MSDVVVGWGDKGGRREVAGGLVVEGARSVGSRCRCRGGDQSISDCKHGCEVNECDCSGSSKELRCRVIVESRY